MRQLPPAFAPLGEYNQFICCKLVPDASGGKAAKVPISARSGLNCNPHDPAHWMSYHDAATAAQALSCGVGFVLTEADPFFCVDVDNAWDGEKWSDTAQAVFASFPGAAFEVSLSGTGFHLFGRYTHAIEHSSKRVDLGVEFYTGGRYIWLTGTNAEGSCPELQLHFETFAANWFPPTAAAPAIVWADQAVPEYSGPADDTELINKMLLSRPSFATLQGEAPSILELWTGAETLGKFYPDSTQGRAFDNSSADLAGCTKLAFWTGKNPVRIDRLFRLSGLVRDKWLERENYRIATIEKAIDFCSAVLGSAQAAPAAVPGTEPVAVDARAAYQLLAPDQQHEYFAGCVYVIDRHQVLTPRGTFLNPPQFKAAYGGYVFAMSADSSDTTKNAFECLTESRAVRFNLVDQTTFRPEDPPGTRYDEGGLRLINSYVPVVVPSYPGDVSPIIGLIEKMLPDERMRLILISYCAAMVQHIGVKFQWAPCIQGVEGNGKTLLLQAMAMAMGRKYTHFPNADDLKNKFNLWLAEKLFIGVEEIHQGKDPGIADALKGMITNTIIGLQGKGTNQITTDNRANFIFCSNRKDAVIKSATDRRYCPLFTAQQVTADLDACGMGGNYFPQTWRWLLNGGGAHWTHFLQTFAIPAEFNPAGDCHRAPETLSTAEAMAHSHTRAYQIISDSIEEQRTGFRGGWVSSIWMAIGFRGEHGPGTHRKDRADALAEQDYILHPGLHGGRSPIRLPSEENSRPLIYCKRGSIQATLTGPAIMQAYIKAQAEDVTELMKGIIPNES